MDSSPYYPLYRVPCIQYARDSSGDKSENSDTYSDEPSADQERELDHPLCLVVSHRRTSSDGNESDNKDMLPTPPGSPEEAKRPPVSMAGLSLPSRLTLSDSLVKPVAISADYANKPLLGDRTCLGMLPTFPSLPFLSPELAENPIIARALQSSAPKRPRGEKKPIPAEAKDDKYFERRRRNNYAAKKSRDARKAREDQIAVRATLLEKENAVLRAQVATLREEADSLRQLLVQKRHERLLSM